ncbi:MAG: copper resistance protein [Acetobacteraceae bacterium]|nr:copper resistance protein [Acetobacteraceae bacterium]
MELLIDLFGYLSIIVHGLTILAQSMALGGVLFLVLLARPLRRVTGIGVPRRTATIAAWSALGLATAAAATVTLQTAVLIGTLDVGLLGALGGQATLAGLVKIAASFTLALSLFRWKQEAPAWPLLALCCLILAAATLTTHAAARLDGRGPLLAAAFLHQAGAAIWIGGIPSFIAALAWVDDGASFRAIGSRFSRMSMVGVACILASGIVMSVWYIGDWEGFYGTAYGVMVAAKIALFLMLLGLGGLNFLVVERLRANPATPVIRLRRCAEAEIGIGVALFFAAASLTAVPPAVDLPKDRATWSEIVARNIPEWPRLSSPDHDRLAIPALQARLDAEAAQHAAKSSPAFIPGAGDLPPRNADDIAWSEYNHHWSGLFVTAIGLLALLNRAGIAWAKHWPLLFIGLGIFLFIRSDPEVWPLGEIGFLESFRDIEVLQHRVFVALLIGFSLFEWRVRVGKQTGQGAALVFPLMCAIGGGLLLTHSHALANVKEQLLIEVTHTPLALAGIVAGWSRWLELRLDRTTGPVLVRVAGWTWPVCLLLCGLILLDYREA